MFICRSLYYTHIALDDIQNRASAWPDVVSGIYATSPESRAALPSPQAPAKSQRPLRRSQALEQLKKNSGN
ncbi:hypothetical protein M431DRAFT_506282 [Trichoderma harzianum CBS 226.95]|uniref:Uncharacterized protein n=1 Tax=Trichoderma harzianum CBS 226.95 TaxID=983964 RepID=A0A2T4AHJ9_TRIHA|nr:hypothetical protein M431DRAFT_506282 [Trichoderma harzianum CBS 226.95]PTB56527.1 hypothetical protein M431DRAFT_506282 [Trichoderma harzianum CBS 226.95]